MLFLARHNVSICGVGVSATGQIDDRSGVVIGTNGKIPHYEETPIKEKLEQALGAPVWALNDANAAALGECAFGGGRGCRNAVFITLGTGVGGGLVLDGRLYGGARGIAGELGHFTLYQEGPACPCGKRGCFEHYASVTALIRRAHEAAPETEWNGRKIFERAAQGDAVLLRVLETWIDDIAAGLTGLVHLFNPEAVLIGGGVSAQEKLLIEPLRRRVLQGVMPRFAEKLRVEAAMLGNDAGLLGAVRFFLEREGRL